MKYVLIVLIILAALAVLYVLSLRGRRGHKGLAELRKYNYAHRGLHDESRPENSLSAFRAAMENGYGVELDLHLLADGELAVIHDSALKRTTGAEGRVEDLTAEQLPQYRLEGTLETIPTFRQVMDLFDGKVPMIVELKPVNGNYAKLCQTACEMLASYGGPYCIESFDPRCVYWLKKHRPQVIRGQLAENFLRVKNSPVPWVLRFCLTYQLFNFLLLPDFTAYKFADRKNLSSLLVEKLWGVQGVSWTLKNQAQHDAAVTEDWIPIFENYIP